MMEVGEAGSQVHGGARMSRGRIGILVHEVGASSSGGGARVGQWAGRESWGRG